MKLELSANSKEIPACPVCNGIGQVVRKITVEHQVQPNVEIDEEQFFLCRTPECEVAYYTPNSQVTIKQNQLINKIWFKHVPSPIPICYCANVTEEEILHHIAVAQCCSTLEDIKKHTGANTGCECLTKNPAGG
ncbi:(2Fe-2S)-binding protein [Desulfitobacterium sp.]|uniref:(2Fe-2S)-binding protein n=1 Tax=Desulfitobacterium sp. TaxID=49981 RepID=UPI0039C8B4B5